MRRWLHPDEGLDQVLEKIAVEQFLNVTSPGAEDMGGFAKPNDTYQSSGVD